MAKPNLCGLQNKLKFHKTRLLITTNRIAELERQIRAAGGTPEGLNQVVEVRLNKNMVTLVEPEDAAVANLPWYASFTGERYYVVANYMVGKTIITLRLSRLVMERVIGRKLKPFEYVKHVNGNSLDNRRSNLEIYLVERTTPNKKDQPVQPVYVSQPAIPPEIADAYQEATTSPDLTS